MAAVAQEEEMLPGLHNTDKNDTHNNLRLLQRMGKRSGAKCARVRRACPMPRMAKDIENQVVRSLEAATRNGTQSFKFCQLGPTNFGSRCCDKFGAVKARKVANEKREGVH